MQWVKDQGVVSAADQVAAVAQVQPLVEELPHAVDLAKKKKKANRRRIRPFQGRSLHYQKLWIHTVICLLPSQLNVV